jgi:hypothetical protein
MEPLPPWSPKDRWGGFGRGEADSPPNQNACVQALAEPTPLPINRPCVLAPFTGPTSAFTWQVDGVKGDPGTS